ncbi:MAG: cytochrome c oxidase subunit 3 [Gemmatimonadota bacterium]|nr:MAG: cytochrome c oxidase subunit 3 [Gemmatimonadota bacterium]
MTSIPAGEAGVSGPIPPRAAVHGKHPIPSAGPYPMGLMALLATVSMLFAAFTASMIVRRGGSDWVRITLPSVVWINTVLLAGSTVAVEMARAAVRRDASSRSVRWLALGTVLGVLFLVGQVQAWVAWAAQGVFLPTSPHASFFYMLTAIHGAHVIGGLGAMLWTLRRSALGAYRSGAHLGLTHMAIFWHFMGAIWVYLLVLLSIL